MADQTTAKTAGSFAKGVPVVLQLEALECGAASLAMILAYYGKWVPLDQVRLACGVSRDGSNAKNLLRAARDYGLTAKGYRFEPEGLLRSGQFPCILHWNMNHFLVLDGFRKGKAVLNDPARGMITVSMEEFNQSFSGICLFMEPSKDFRADGKKPGLVADIRKNLKGTEAAFAFTLLLSVLTGLVWLIKPAFSRVFMDQLLTGRNPAWVSPFFLLFGVFTLIQILLMGIKALCFLKLQGKLAITANARYMWHILRMPVEFFSQRLAGDLAGRKSTHASVAATLINTLAPILINVLMMGIYLVVILRYSVVLTLIGICGMGINIAVNHISATRRLNISRVQMRDQARLESTGTAGIAMIETIKASGAENGFFEKWSGFQASVNTASVKDLKVDLYYGMIPSLVNAAVNTVILAIGLYYCMQGQFTVGMLYAFQTMLASFVYPAMQMAEAGETVREMHTYMERIDDVCEYPVDVEYGTEDLSGKSFDKLSGTVELKNVTFGYSRLAPPLIENFSMTLHAGQKVAFVGGSGCGKSTLSKLISGLYKPWSGEILFDGVPASQIDRNVFTGSLAVVDQDITLFEDTVANNLKMWDTTIEDYEMILASRDASLHEDIMQRDGGYQYRLEEGGKNFSGGQRQRMEIARVLAEDPTILIMDEATSALDAKTEYEVVKAIKDRGITCIVIAHRLSTIRDCDEIIVMEHGKIVERGRHEELLKNHGTYEQLIMSE